MTDPQKTDPPEPKGDDGDDIAAVRREAAGYRTKLREAETERDTLAERLGNFQRREAERVASTAADDFRPLADGADLWHGDAELSALVAEDGTVSVGAVHERVTALGEKRPHYLAAPTTPAGGADQGRGEARKEDELPSFGEALKSA